MDISLYVVTDLTTWLWFGCGLLFARGSVTQNILFWCPTENTKATTSRKVLLCVNSQTQQANSCWRSSNANSASSRRFHSQQYLSDLRHDHDNVLVFAVCWRFSIGCVC